MKNFKKFLTLVLAVMMVVSSFAFSTSAATTKFEDIDAKDEALVEAVDLLAYMGIAKGKSETNFGADELVTREQFALFMYRFMKGGKDAPAGASNTTKFTDLEDSTYFYAISWANATGIVNGKSATTFAPKDGIKLQEAYAMIVRALDWEKENDLVYPFGHIEVAEKKGVELDENLASSIGYTDELTRADMAILLYNAFFAETGIEETETFIRTVDYEDYEDQEDYTEFYFVEETYNPVFCVKHFDAIEVEYQAVATPNRRIDGDVDMYGEATEATYDLGYDAIFFEKVSADTINPEKVAPDYAYITAEDIRVDAADLDNYFLGVFTMYVTTDEDEEIDKVLFADCNMTSKTVDKVELATVSSNKEASYYVAGGEQTPAKLLSGKVTVDGEDAYVFNAPYSYVKPSYAGLTTDAAKYWARNKDNVKAIEFALDRDAEDDDETVVMAARNYIVNPGYYNTDGDYDKYFTEQAEQLVDTFETAYYEGLHEATLYDVDGDGRYEYINYIPYRFFQVDSDEKKEFSEDSVWVADDDHDFPYIYTNEATVVGEDFADEDYVIGYYAPDMDMVKVAAVVKPTVDTLDNYRYTAGTITLGNGDKVDVTGAYKLLANIAPITGDIAFDADAEFTAQIEACELFDNDLIDDEYEFYIYDGVLLYYGDVDSNYKFTENLIIPTHLTLYGDEVEHDGDVVSRYPEQDFNAEAGRVWYIYAWVDGKMKYVPVVTEDVQPKLIVDGEIAEEYLDKLCTYSVDEDGVYTIKSLGYDVDDDETDVYEGVNKDGLEEEGYANFDEFEGFDALDNTKKEDLQLYVDGQEGTITKVAGSRFNIPGFDRTVDLKAYTKIVIRVWDDEEGEFTYNVYDASSFKKSLDDGVTLENVSYIVSNNPNSKSRENLVVLYAETDDVSFKGEADKDSYRVISDYTPGDDEDGLWRFYYDLYNPFTGEKVLGVPGTNAEKKASMLDDSDAIEVGHIVELEDGMVNDEKAKFDKGAVSAGDLVYITEVDEAEGFFAVADYNVVTDNGTIECKDCIKDNVEDFSGEVRDFITHDPIVDGNGNDTTFIEYDKNTAFAVITRNYKFEEINHWVDGKMAPTTIEAIADAEKELLCYNNWAKDRNGKYVTGYADYVKAYVAVVDEKLDDDELPVADFVVVIVNKDEAAALDSGEDYCGNAAH